MDGDESAIGIKNVTINEPFFQGHFPNFPIMPGVLIIEGLAQTAGALCVHNLADATYKPQLVYFMGIDRAKFRKPVVPGDQLHYHVQKIRSRGRAWRFYGEAKVNGQVVAEAEISAMILDPDDAKMVRRPRHRHRRGRRPARRRRAHRPLLRGRQRGRARRTASSC